MIQKDVTFRGPGTELHELAQERDEARRIGKDLLLMPFSGLGNWARQNACVFFEHPPKSERYTGCACGARKDSA